MKVVVFTKYGSPEVLQIRDVEKPIPKDNEVLIKVFVTTVTVADHRVRSLDLPTGFGPIAPLVFGITKPRNPILGTELSGIVETVGKSVTKFKKGDQVFAFPGLRMGSYVEYKCMPENGMVTIKPQKLTFEEAAALSFGGTTALNFLRKGKLQRNENILINGASGCVGTAAVQLAANYFGADVTGVCSTSNIKMVKSLGANRVIDYTKEDFTEKGNFYDMVVDAVGTAPFPRSQQVLKPGGRLLQVVNTLTEMLQIPWINLTSGKKVIAGSMPERVKDLEFLAQLAIEGKFKPVIDKSYQFEQIVDAHSYVDQGHKKGNVVIIVNKK